MVKCANIYETTLDIDPLEIDQVLHTGGGLMAKLALEGAYARLYALKDSFACQRRLLYLYLIAIESFLPCEGASNWMTEQQLTRLMSEVEQLFKICQS